MGAAGFLRLTSLLSAFFLCSCAQYSAWEVWDSPVIRPDQGVGPIRFGMKKNQVFSRLGPVHFSSLGSIGRGVANLPRVETEGYSYDGRFLHLQIYSDPDVGVQEISIADYHHMRWIPWHRVPRTASGITLGSTLAQVKAAYGEPNRVTDFPDGTNMMEYDALGMRIDSDKTGRVDYIELHRSALGPEPIYEALAQEYEKIHPPSSAK